MLKLGFRRAEAADWFGAGWFNPRKDGPLITGGAELTGAAAGSGVFTAVGAGADAATDSAAFRATGDCA